MKPNGKTKLVLQDGREFTGTGFGASGTPVVGELVFNTSMVGYQEIISDPSYKGQIVVMTYPLMGQYGIMAEDYESRSAGLAGLIVRECCESPSNFRFTKTLSEELSEHGVPGIEGLDTRMLTHIIADEGSMKAAIVDGSVSRDEALKLIEASRNQSCSLKEVSCTKRWFSRTPQHNYDVVVLDCGLKHSTVSALNRLGCNVTIVPFDTKPEEINAFNPDGLLIAGGPSDPAELDDIVNVIKAFIGRIPVVGTGLGHLLIARAFGAKTVKMKCGHHGGRPIRNLDTLKICTAEHNHNYCVEETSLKGSGLKVIFKDVADGTVEGLCSTDRKVLSVQFCPEGGPGPEETDFFGQFVKLMEE